MLMLNSNSINNAFFSYRHFYIYIYFHIYRRYIDVLINFHIAKNINVVTKIIERGKRLENREWRSGICTSRTTQRKSKTGRNVVID